MKKLIFLLLITLSCSTSNNNNKGHANHAISENSLKKISSIDLSSLPIVSDDTRLGACDGNVGKFLCIGLNYSDHAAESGMAVPSEPILFQKLLLQLSVQMIILKYQEIRLRLIGK